MAQRMYQGLDQQATRARKKKKHIDVVQTQAATMKIKQWSKKCPNFDESQNERRRTQSNVWYF